MSYREEEEYKKPFDIKVWFKMLPFFKPYRSKLITIIVLMLSCGIVDVLMPLFQKYGVDNFIMKSSLSGMPQFAGLYFVSILFQVLAVVLFTRMAIYVEMCIGRDLKSSCFNHLQELSFDYYNTTPVGFMMARVMSDTGRIGGMVAWGLVDILWALTYVIGVFISMLILNAQLALLVMLVVPLIAIATAWFQGKLLNENRRIRKINSQLTGAFNEGINGARTSKILSIEDRNLEEFSEVTGKMYQSSMKYSMLNAAFIPVVVFCSSIATAIVLVKGGYMAMEDIKMLGTLSVFITYASSIFGPIQQLAKVFADFVSTQANIERVTELLEKKPYVTDTPEVEEKYGTSLEPKKENWEDIKGDIEFCDVSFKYPDGNEYILENFNLKVASGTMVAIVGETGAGKSTLVNLACRFFEPTSGKILIDGIDYKNRSQLWLHSKIGYVLQTPHLFSGSVRENILYGNLDATEQDIINAANLVSAEKTIAKLKDGYDSNVGESGDMLSTGEKQLISFARAVISNPRIFILDEATASIDTQTEALIQNAISKLLENRTAFVIAHRLSTIRKADIILVVKEGRIIEQGTHNNLIDKQGYYYSLYTKQFQQEAEEVLYNVNNE